MRRAACIGKLAVITVLLAGGSSCQEATGASTAESVLAHLTGGGQRVWVKTLFRIALSGQASRCESGEEWVFGHDGRGVKRTCENGVSREQQFTWAWVGSDSDRPVLKVDGKQYLAELRQQKAQVEDTPPMLVTVLRTLRDKQDEPFEEITLRFQDM